MEVIILMLQVKAGFDYWLRSYVVYLLEETVGEKERARLDWKGFAPIEKRIADL